MSPGFDMASSEQAFSTTVYPILREHCARCHSLPPEGRAQMPMHAHADIATSHMFVLPKVNLRQPEASKLWQRQALEGHNCWSDCKQNGEQMLAAIRVWSEMVRGSLPVSTLPVAEGEVTEQQVLQWIAADKAKIAPADAPYIQYASLHQLHNRKATFDDMNTARAGISKILNSTTRWAPDIVNPKVIDPYSLVYRFDVRDYWGYSINGAKNPMAGITAWNRIKQGNFNADDQVRTANSFGNKDTPANSVAKMTPTFPNIAGFYPEYTEATQLGYTLSRPDVYADVMQLGTNSATLERQLGVVSKGVDSWKFMTIDDAITINKRMLLRSTTPSGFFWKGVDPFSQAPFIFYDRPIPEMDAFSLVKTTPVFDSEGRYAENHAITEDASGNLVGGPQAQASEMIFSMPNGLQGYFVGGAANQIRVDAFPFIVIDPRRGGALPANFPFRLGPGSELRLLGPASCMACHVDGMNGVNQDMRPYVDDNPGKFDAATVERVKQLYPTTEEVRKQVDEDRQIYTEAMNKIRDEMVVGISDKTLYVEPIMFLFESAQLIFNYQPTASN